MEPQRPPSRQLPGGNEMPVPPRPPVIDVLPIPAADSNPADPPAPTHQSRTRHQRSQSSLLMELLSRRMGRQALIQQNQSRATPRQREQTLRPSRLSYCQPSLLVEDANASDDKPGPPSSPIMEVDLDDDPDDFSFLAAVSATTTASRMSHQHHSHTAPTPPETRVDPSVTARVLARLQSNARPSSGPSSGPSTPCAAVPTLEIDPADKLAADLEADEGYSEVIDNFSWLEDQGLPESGLTGTMRSQGVLRFTTSSEAALRCPKLVRNIPRMRKRKLKKKEQRLRAGPGSNNSHVAVDAGTTACRAPEPAP